MNLNQNQPHLRYESVAAWMAGENVPPDFIRIADSKLREKFITQYGELRRCLFASHAATLSPEEQAQLDQGEHPSQRHEFADRAKPIAELFERELQRLGFAAQVGLGFYSCDRIVLSVALSTKPTRQEQDRLPWLFRGFEVMYR